jgi:hypothetical protein
MIPELWWKDSRNEEDISVGNQKFVKFGEINCQPIQQNVKAYSNRLPWKQINDI